jgi:hypothetical protein
MPRTEPPIDDRTFDQILDDLRFRIPRYTKEWTNFNDSDPGMTLLQLFAWLSEMMLFRMNQVPRKNYIKFLKLLGEELEPPRPAGAHLTFVSAGSTTAEPVPERTPVAAAATDGGEPLIFETERGLDLISPLLDAVGLFNGAAFFDATAANQKPGTTFKPFGAVPSPGNALYLGFVPLPEPTEPVFPQTMTFRVFLPPKATAGKPQSCQGKPTPPIPPVTLAWEYRPKQDEEWQRLNVLEDQTAAFTREGYIRVEGPRQIAASTERLRDEPRLWIRVRLDSGLRYAAGRAPEIDFLRPNTVDAVNLSTVRGEVLGESDGRPSEEFETQHRPVASLTLHVTGPTGEEETWTRVDDFFASKPKDAHYRLNGDSGVVQFGDGDRGRIPEAGSSVVAVEYRYGGGKRGNTAGPGAISDPRTTLVGVDKVTNERPAVGGSDEQSLEQILLEGPSILRRRSRAVTPEDFISLVKEMGGIAQATAIPLFHPGHPGVSVPGALTVVVVPDNDDKPPNPSSDLIAAICDSLDNVRLLTTEVFVKGPTYQQVRVEARVSANPYAAFDAVTRDVLTALGEALDPRKGTFGKDFSPTRLFSTILGVKDVVAVINLNVYVDGRRRLDLSSIAVPADGMLYGGGHIITVEPPTDR